LFSFANTDTNTDPLTRGSKKKWYKEPTKQTRHQDGILKTVWNRKIHQFIVIVGVGKGKAGNVEIHGNSDNHSTQRSENTTLSEFSVIFCGLPPQNLHTINQGRTGLLPEKRLTLHFWMPKSITEV
jgi:hypothetical protein